MGDSHGTPDNRNIKVAFFDTKPYDRGSFERMNREYGFTLSFFPNHLIRDTLVLAAGFQAVCIFVNDYVTAEIAQGLSAAGVRLIALRSSGYNNVDLQHLPPELRVVRVPAYSPHAVAEHTLALIMTLNRKTHRAYFRTRDNNFTITGLQGFDMYGKTAGVIGTGKIGRLVCEILSCIGMRVLASDPYRLTEWAEERGIVYTDLDTLYRESDIISLHCPLTRENAHMIGDSAVGTMKPGVMIINTGRGKLIDTKALIRGLKSGRIGAAGLDVYEEETEYFFEDYSAASVQDDVLARLLTFPNVLVTSHQAFFTKEAMENIAQTTLSNIRAFFAGEALENEVCAACG